MTEADQERRRCFEALFREHAAGIASYCRWQSRSPGDADDGSAASQILSLATGLEQARQPDGTTVYTGSIPDSSVDLRVNPADDAILRMITSLRTGNAPGAPSGLHGALKLQLTAGSDGRVQQVSVTFQQQDTGSPAGDGTYTWSVTYSQLGATPPITVPGGSNAAPSAGGRDGR